MFPQKKFDYIYSSWVLMHVPPYELNNYFQNIFRLMHNKTKFYFDFMHSIITLKQNALTWGYNSSKIINKQRCSVLDISEVEVDHKDGRGYDKTIQNSENQTIDQLSVFFNVEPLIEFLNQIKREESRSDDTENALDPDAFCEFQEKKDLINFKSTLQKNNQYLSN